MTAVPPHPAAGAATLSRGGERVEPEAAPVISLTSPLAGEAGRNAAG